MSDLPPGGRTQPSARRASRETPPLRAGLTLTALLLAAFGTYTWLVVVWSPFIALDSALNRNFHVQSLWSVLHVLDRVGQRAVCLPVLLVVVALVGWRHRSWRPALLGAVGVAGVNLLVLVVKLALSRGAPLSGTSFFADGDLYPSGHTANIVVVYGLCYYLVTHYGQVSRAVHRVLVTMVCLLPVVMFSTSLLLRWHWFSDLVGGFLLGGAVLALIVGIDAAVPFRSGRLVVGQPLPEASAPRPTDGLDRQVKRPSMAP